MPMKINLDLSNKFVSYTDEIRVLVNWETQSSYSKELKPFNMLFHHLVLKLIVEYSIQMIKNKASQN